MYYIILWLVNLWNNADFKCNKNNIIFEKSVEKEKQKKDLNKRH